MKAYHITGIRENYFAIHSDRFLRALLKYAQAGTNRRIKRLSCAHETEDEIIQVVLSVS